LDIKALIAKLLTAVFSILLLLNGWFYLQQPAMTFFPTRELIDTPAAWGVDFENVELTTADGVALRGWYLPHRHATRTVLFFHGNGGNISHRRDSLLIFHRLGLNVLIIDYRGYGRSGGKPSEMGLYEDAATAWRYLVDERGVGGEDIVIFGRSLGGSVAVQLASEVKPAALILESAFSSTRDMARALFPILSRVVWLRYEFNAVARIDRIGVPLLMLHSPQDEIIPYRFGRKLYEAAAEPKRFVDLQGDHNSGFMRSQPHYERSLGLFLHGLGPGAQRRKLLEGEI